MVEIRVWTKIRVFTRIRRNHNLQAKNKMQGDASSLSPVHSLARFLFFLTEKKECFYMYSYAFMEEALRMRRMRICHSM